MLPNRDLLLGCDLIHRGDAAEASLAQGMEHQLEHKMVEALDCWWVACLEPEKAA